MNSNSLSEPLTLTGLEAMVGVSCFVIPIDHKKLMDEGRSEIEGGVEESRGAGAVDN